MGPRTLNPLAGCAIFVLFCLTMIVALPYMLVIRLLGWLGVVRLEREPSITATPVAIAHGHAVCVLDLWYPDRLHAEAVALLATLAPPDAVVYGEDMGPFALEDLEPMLLNVHHGISRTLWLVDGTIDDLSLLRRQMSAEWSEEVDFAPLADGSARSYLRMTCITDQGSFNASMLACGDEEYVRRVAAAATP